MASNRTYVWIGALFALVLTGLIVLLVIEWPWAGIVLFLGTVLIIFAISAGSEGWRKAAWEAAKRLFTGW